MLAEVEGFRVAAAGVVDGVDRSVIGRFGHAREVLVLVKALMLSHDAWWAGDDMKDVVIALSAAVDEACDRTGSDIAMVAIELRFWSGDEGRRVSGAAGEYRFHLGLLVEFPQWYDYFDAGLWDVELISRFDGEGVDAVLASRMVG